MSDEPLGLEWLDEVSERARGTEALVKQASDVATKVEEPDEEPDAVDAWVTDLAERLQGNREGNRDLLLKAGYSTTEADDLMADHEHAPSAETLLQKSKSMSASMSVWRRIGQGRNGAEPD